jgi:Holliday junction resolvase-like predicted endonuclease
MRLGSHAETLVAARLSRSGMRIVARNQRTSEVAGEIDLIALDGRELVLVEVKALSAGAMAGPERPVLTMAPLGDTSVLSCPVFCQCRKVPALT